MTLQSSQGLGYITFIAIVSGRTSISTSALSCPKFCPSFIECKASIGAFPTSVRLRVGVPCNIIQEMNKTSILQSKQNVIINHNFRYGWLSCIECIFFFFFACVYTHQWVSDCMCKLVFSCLKVKVVAWWDSYLTSCCIWGSTMDRCTGNNFCRAAIYEFVCCSLSSHYMS